MRPALLLANVNANANAIANAIALALVLSYTSPAAAASRESVEAMLAEIGMAQSWDATVQARVRSMFESAERTVATRIATSPARTPRQIRTDDAMAQTRQLLQSVDLSWNTVGSDIVQVYADVYAQQDLDALLVFYRSPAGHALLTKKQPARSTPTQGSATQSSPTPGTPTQDASKLLDPQVFTQDEIDGAQAFFQSPAAKAINAAMPQIDKRLNQIFAARVERVMPQIRKMSLALEAANAAETAGKSGAPQ